MAKHPRHKDRLTVKKIARLKAGRHIDGGGLSLLVSDIGSKSWVYRYERKGKDRAYVMDTLHGNGGARAKDKDGKIIDTSRGLTLDEARAEAAKNLALLKQGIDPIDHRNGLKQANIRKAAEDAKLKTFEMLAVEYSDAHATDWIPEDRHRFLQTLRAYAFPKIGPLLPDAINVELVKSVLEPIWISMNPTADRIRSRIENVLDYAIALDLRSNANPAKWEVLETVLPKKTTSGKHHAALPYADIPAFVARLASYRGTALEFLILTASRTSEVLEAVWSEIELRAVQVMVRNDEGKETPVMGPVWVIPAERMKEGRQHRVPLSNRAVEILEALPQESDFVFLGSRKGKPLGKNSLTNLLTAMGHDDITVHGMRSTFRDWVGEETEFTADVAEAAISHVVGSKTQTSYQHGTLFEKRRILMQKWCAYCHGAPIVHDADVLPFKKAGA